MRFFPFIYDVLFCLEHSEAHNLIQLHKNILFLLFTDNIINKYTNRVKKTKYGREGVNTLRAFCAMHIYGKAFSDKICVVAFMYTCSVQQKAITRRRSVRNFVLSPRLGGMSPYNKSEYHCLQAI